MMTPQPLAIPALVKPRNPCQPWQNLPSQPRQFATPTPGNLPPFNPGNLPGPQQSNNSLEQSKKRSSSSSSTSSRGTRTRRGPRKTNPAAAADFDSDSSTNTDTRHVCPKCENTWPKHYGAVCFKCQCNVERAKRQAQTAEEYLAEINAEEAASYSEETTPVKRPTATAVNLNSATGGRLPESWLYHQNLKTLIASRDFREVCGIVSGIEASKLPEPKAFFDAYDQHLEAHNQGEAELKALWSKHNRHSRQAA